VRLIKREYKASIFNKIRHMTVKKINYVQIYVITKSGKQGKKKKDKIEVQQKISYEP
jgi:hypothetical protein